MYGDRCLYLVVLIMFDPEEIVYFACEHSLLEDVLVLARESKVHELIQGVLDGVNVNYARVE